MTLSIIQFTNRIIKKLGLRRGTSRWYNVFYNKDCNLERRTHLFVLVKHFGKFRVHIGKSTSCKTNCLFYSGYVRISRDEFMDEFVTPEMLKREIRKMVDEET